VYRKKLTGIPDVFAMFSPDFMADGRELHEQEERDWGDQR
jgi:antitoxin VapB